jgi:hypothetical protein
MAEQAAQRLKQELERQLGASEAARDSYLSQLADTAATSRANATDEVAGDEEPALTVLKDKTLPAETRVDLLRRLTAGIIRHDSYIEALLAIVQDGDDDAEVRSATLRVLATAAFSAARFRAYEQSYEQALRNLVTDGDARLREAAVVALAVRHDPEVQQTLLAGLQGDGPLPVARERAIQLLAEDDHLDNLPWLRELYDSASDDLRQEAVRLMSSYADASELLETVIRDKDEATQVRQQSAASLRNVAPERFEDVAKEIVTDSSDYPEVRTVSLVTLQHLGCSERVYGDADFLRRLEDIGADESAPEVARHARDLIERLPEVR